MLVTTPETAFEIRAGDILAGKYRVERILGAGGMGMVVSAHHIQLDERVALKFLLPAAVANLESVARFLREARTAFKIKNEHVARVTDIGQLENGSPYIVMEYLEGKDLAAWLVDHGAMSIPQGVDFILQACEAIAEAHALGIVHRDLKPANLFCVQRADGQPSIKVLDFGISKVTNETMQAHAMTKTNGVVGSPLYMSPEHMKSAKSVDARTDIWSLGIILFQILAGRAPFEAEAVTELVLKVATEPATPLRRFRPDAPEGLERVLFKCLEKDRTKRFQSVGELAVALSEFAPPHARVSVDRIVGTLEMAGNMKPLDALAQSGTNPALGAPIMPIMPHTLATWNEVHPGRSRTAIGLTAAISVAAVVVLGFLAYLNLSAAPGSDLSPVASTSAVLPPPSMAQPPAMGAAPPATTHESVPQPPPTTSATSATPPLMTARPPPHHQNSRCDPPYTVQPNGTRRYKPECLQ